MTVRAAITDRNSLGGSAIERPGGFSDRPEPLRPGLRRRGGEDGCVAARCGVDVDEESSGSKLKFCPHSIFSMSAGAGRGFLKCEDDRSLLSQRL